MTISSAMDDLWKSASDEGLTDRLAGIGDNEDIIVFALNFLRSNMLDVFEVDETEDEVDSESVETWKCNQCGTDCSAIQCRADSSDDDEWLDCDLIEETDYLEEDDE